MDPECASLLRSISGDHGTTPLREITEAKLREKHMLFKELAPIINVKGSQIKRILAGESGTRPAGIRAFQEFLEIPADTWTIFWNNDTNRARSYEEFSVLRNSALENTETQPSITPNQVSRPTKSRGVYGSKKLVVPCLLAFGAFYAITGFNKKVDQPNITNSQGPCLVELREMTPSELTCDGIGAFSATGSTLEKWNTKTSLIFVPDGWDAIVRYETWGGQNYSVLQEDKSGFVKLHAGYNHLDSDTYDVYDNESLTGKTRRSSERELNDRIQYLIVANASESDPLVVWEHDEKNDANLMKIQLKNIK